MDLTRVTRTLTTRDLHLRSPNLGDSEAMHALLSDAETVQYWISTPIDDQQISTDKLAEYLASNAEGESIEWAVCLKNQTQMIGRCVFFHFDEPNRRAEIGFILNRYYWRRGLMRQAVEAVIEFGFTTLGLHRIEADVDPGNAGSLALLESIGFKREGYFPERWLVGGEWKDSVMLGLLKSS